MKSFSLICITLLNAVPSSTKESVLRRKFSEYDTNKDSSLSFAEEFVFSKQMSRIFGCTTVFSNLRELFDADNDNAITLQEWFAFFGLSLQGTCIIMILNVCKT